jgi:hypothetical protein
MRNLLVNHLSAIGIGLFLSQLVIDSGQADPSPSKQLAQTTCSASDQNRSTPPFRCITPAIFQCLKANKDGRDGSLDYKGDTKGDIVVKSNVAGNVALLGFQFDASAQTLNLNVKRKNPILSEQTIWDGFRNTISRCRQTRGR